MASYPSDGAASELDRFREEWRREVQQRLRKEAPEPPPDTLKPEVTVEHTTPATTTKRRASSASQNVLENPSTHASVNLKRVLPREVPDMKYNTVTKSALALYAEAVHAEQSGDYSTATELYRRSFRLEPNVDRVYQRSIQISEAKSIGHASVSAPSNAPVAMQQPSVPIGQPLAAISSTPSELTHAIDALLEGPHEFAPEDPGAPMPISSMPDELLLHILCEFASRKDVTTLERFALVCRKARLVTLDSTLWRLVAFVTYRPPQVGADAIPSMLMPTYGNYRTMYINHPRVRFDGVYISVCHYVRRGHHENPWVAVSHLITYHRYLRFLPDGRVLSMLCNDEVAPAQVISTMKPSLRMKGHNIGTWRLEGSTVAIEDLFDSEGINMRYGFTMNLALRSKPVGRWNRMEITEYCSVHQESGETLFLPLKNERPFWFSKVRSFAA